jgi:isopenicillin N synthase-like dioxygenase
MGAALSTSAITPIPLALRAADPNAFSARLIADFRRWGFAVIGDHGLDEGAIAAAEQAARAFFALPPAAKSAYIVAGGAGQRGYTSFGREAAKGAATVDLKEFWHVGREGAVGLPPNLWPSELPHFRPVLLRLYDSLEALGGQILGALARGLGLAPDFFDLPTRGGDSILRLLHYPPGRFEGPGLRAGPHEDINAITLLLGAEEAGLEILGREGRWLPIHPPAGAVVVNIGDMLSRLVNDELPSTTHRVVNPPPERWGVARYSMPFFLHFRPDFLIETLPHCIAGDRPNRYPVPITAGEFLRQRLSEIGLI